LGRKIKWNGWVAAVLALVGMFFICIEKNEPLNVGDLLIIISSVFFGVQMVAVDKFVFRVDPIKLSLLQQSVCAVCCLVGAFIFEDVNLSAILNATWPIIYAGLFSAGLFSAGLFSAGLFVDGVFTVGLVLSSGVSVLSSTITSSGFSVTSVSVAASALSVTTTSSFTSLSTAPVISVSADVGLRLSASLFLLTVTTVATAPTVRQAAATPDTIFTAMGIDLIFVNTLTFEI
jgi:hypothetical protein